MEEIVRMRHSLEVDPQLTIWGWQIPVYLFLGGLVAGVMVLSALLLLRRPRPQGPEQAAPPSTWLRWAPWLAPVLISVGMLVLMLDLEYKAHVFRFYTAFRPTSPMSWGAWILVGVYPASLLLGLANLLPRELAWLEGLAPLRWLHLGRPLRWATALGRRHRRALLWANLALGAGLGIYTGILLSSLGTARVAWSSALLGPLFLVSGISTGAALLMLLPLAEAEHGRVRLLDMAAIGTELALLILFFIGLGAGGRAGQQALGLFFGGAYTAVFWSLVVAAGLLAPLALELLESRRGLRPTLLAPALLLFGGLSLRWILVLAGQA